jgi:hypothetical protein
MPMILSGRTIYPGHVSGLTLVSKKGISFYGGVDPDSGIVVEQGHDLCGQCIAGRLLVFPSGKGSTVGSYTLYRLAKNGKAPVGIINASCETITAVGCIIGGIPCIDQVDISIIPDGVMATLDAEDGQISWMLP